MAGAAVHTAAEAAAFMEGAVASMAAAARMVAEDFREEEVLLAAGALAAGVPRDRALAADRSVALSAVDRLAERNEVEHSAGRNAVRNRAGHRRTGLAPLARVRAIRRRWAADARADSAAAAEETLGLRAVLATEGLTVRGIRSAAEVAVLDRLQAPVDFTRLI